MPVVGWDKERFIGLTKPADFAEAAKIAVAEGYDAVKVDPATLDESGSRMRDINKIQPVRTVRMIHD
jgi:hypothetical protein